MGGRPDAAAWALERQMLPLLLRTSRNCLFGTLRLHSLFAFCTFVAESATGARTTAGLFHEAATDNNIARLTRSAYWCAHWRADKDGEGRGEGEGGEVGIACTGVIGRGDAVRQHHAGLGGLTAHCSRRTARCWLGGRERALRGSGKGLVSSVGGGGGVGGVARALWAGAWAERCPDCVLPADAERQTNALLSAHLAAAHHPPGLRSTFSVCSAPPFPRPSHEP